MNTAKKGWTGERLETYIFSENTNEHLHRYAMALELVKGKAVLDIACGEGYGTNLIAAAAAQVTGVDIDEETVALAAAKYRRDNLRFLTGSAAAIPCNDHSFDVVVSFETIEHHNQHEAMMLEIKRVLKPGGVLIISSPDKQYYSDVPGFKNPYHVLELYRQEFETLIQKHFANAHFFGQRSFYGSVVLAQQAAAAGEVTVFGGNYEQTARGGFDAVYNIAIASDGVVPVLRSSVFNGDAVLRQQIGEAAAAAAAAATQQTSEVLLHTWSYRLGNAIIRPFSAIKKLFNA